MRSACPLKKDEYLGAFNVVNVRGRERPLCPKGQAFTSTERQRQRAVTDHVTDVMDATPIPSGRRFPTAASMGHSNKGADVISQHPG